ncbi:MAG TPA: DUF2378 family protein [Myxococcota bacterium]|jgi:uncharacterized protein (TIGR02265 family)
MSGQVKGGALESRLAYLQSLGAPVAERVLERLGEPDRRLLRRLLPMGWYPFELNQRLDRAIVDELAGNDEDALFRTLGAYSAQHNLGLAHKVYVKTHDPHGLLKQTAPIYRLYYDTGRRTYERTGDTSAVLRTFECETFSRADCLTVVGWHEKAIEMCGGQGARVVETRCRCRGDDRCEYECAWTAPA